MSSPRSELISGIRAELPILVNAFVRPVLFLLTCPLVLLTLGLFVFVLNAFMLWLTAALAGGLGIDFTVRGFWPALLGSLVVSIVSTVLSVFVGEAQPPPRD